MCEYNYIHPGFIFIPCPGMTPGGLRAQYFIPNLTPKCECLSVHSSLLLGPRHHAIPRNQRKQSACRTEANCRPQASLPNLLKKFSSPGRDFFTRLGPQIRLPPVPIFGVNTLTNLIESQSPTIKALTSRNHHTKLRFLTRQPTQHFTQLIVLIL
jgi:hypothetical protein